MILYAIKDELTGFQEQIMIFANDEEAKRNFVTLAKDNTNRIGLWKNDFSIWRIGKMEKGTGEIKQEKNEPELVIRGSSIITEEDIKREEERRKNIEILQQK